MRLLRCTSRVRNPLWLLLSCVAHGAFALLWLITPPAKPEPIALPASIEVAIVEPVLPTDGVLPATDPPSVATKVPTPTRTASARLRAIDAKPTFEAPAVQVPTDQPVERPVLSLSPRAAALSMIDMPGERDAGAAATQDTNQRLQAALADAARKVELPNEPKLEPQPDGSFLYEGNGFDAKIAKDGSLEMNDQHRRSRWKFEGHTGENGTLAGARIFETKFDIFKHMDRKRGNDPYQSERRWFLEHTRALRERLSNEHDRQPIYRNRRD